MCRTVIIGLIIVSVFTVTIIAEDNSFSTFPSFDCSSWIGITVRITIIVSLLLPALQFLLGSLALLLLKAAHSQRFQDLTPPPGESKSDTSLRPELIDNGWRSMFKTCFVCYFHPARALLGVATLGQ